MKATQTNNRHFLRKSVKNSGNSEAKSCCLTVTKPAEPVQDLSEAVGHRRQRLQLDLLEVFGTLVLQVAVSFADAAHDCWRLKAFG